MKKMFYSLFSIVLALSALNLTLPLTSAAELKPVVAVSFAGYSELKADVVAFGKLSGKPELANMLEGMLAMVTQGKGLAGFDQKQPIGAVLLSDGSPDFIPYGFLPVTDLKQLMELMKNSPLGQMIKEENGVYEIPAGMQSVLVTQKGNWAYVVQKKETFDAVANDPAALLGDMPKNYLLALKAIVKNVPDAVRQQALQGLNMLMQMSMMRNPGESDAQYAARTAMMKQNIDQLEILSKELDEVMLGVNIDRQTNNAYLDLVLTAKPGTNLAAQLASAKPGKTDFAGLKLPGAAVTANGTATITDEDVARTKTSLDTIRTSAQEELKNQDLSKEQLDLASGLLNELFDVIIKTIELKKTDYGAALVLEPNAVTFVAGGMIADGAKLEGVVKKLVAEAEKDNAVKIKAETYQNYQLHSLSLPTPEETLVPFVGDTLDVVLGVGDKKVFLAAGRDALKTLKEAIDKSQSDAGKEVPASQLVVSGLKVAKFISTIADDLQVKAMADKIATALEQTGGKDHISIGSQAIDNGARIRLEFEEGILKALGLIMPMGPGM